MVTSSLTPNVKSFTRALKAVAKKIPEKAIVLYHIRTHLALLTLIIQDNPVDTGRSRNAWQTSVGEPPATEVPFESQGPGTGKARETEIDNRVAAQANEALKELEPYSISTLFNNVEYVRYLEEGTSQQAPHGMVAVALETLARDLREKNRLRDPKTGQFLTKKTIQNL